ncbi:MAG TPA: Ig-like domain repeat protein [Actinomycetota bacterium]|nr:Ig-like domain repeat protein [Actinomycetota bacterium]
MSGRRNPRVQGGISAPLNTRRTLRQNVALTAVFALVAMLLLPPGAAFAGIGLSVTPTFPTQTQVGQTFPASLTIQNASTDDEAVGTVTVSDIRMVPSCSTFDPGCNDPGSIPDPDTFTLSPTGVGAVGTACAGRTFAITEVNPATGEVQFIPTDGLPVVLQQPSGANDLDTCRINFTATTNKVPNHDSFPGTPGVQTNQVGSAIATHNINGTIGTGTGTDVTTVQQAAPEIVTQATPTTTVGQPISDTATLSGGQGPAPGPTGTMTFQLYGPDDPDCAGAPIFTDTVPVAGNGNYTSDQFTPTSPGTYRWVVSYSGDVNNAPATSPCNAPNETTLVSQAQPAIVTQASPDTTIGNPISDTATLSGGFNPTGTITFTAYGPDDPTCTGEPAFTSTVPVNGNGTYQSGDFTPTAPGTYQWVAVYSGDANNAPAASPCGDPNEDVVVNQAQPTIVTQATPTVPVGGQISDTATLSDGVNPTGTITFSLFGPGDDTCAGPAIFTDTAMVNGNGVYTSDPFTANAPGTYRWVAVYSGDANNESATSPCNAPNEASVVTQATPTITTITTPTTTVGDPITDTATLAGGFNPTGTITFTLFGPNNPECDGPPLFTSTVPVNGNGDYTSAPFTPTAPGAYRWVAVYSGDANNASVTSPCNAPNETVLVQQAGPTIVTQASPATTVGNPVTDTATLTGGVNPTGTITFTLFGPDDATCAGPPVFTDTVPVNGNGDYTSDPFTPTAPGTYRWVAAYSGDANNLGATSPCNAANESVTVSEAQPAIVTNVTPANASLNEPVTDTATLSGGVNPTGTITFTAFGPNDATCAGAPVYTATVPVNGNGTYTATPAFVPTAPGTYRFVASYSGDANNAGVTAPCNAPNETVEVRQLPSIDVEKTVTPPSRVEPGGDFTFTVVVTNTSDVPLVITSLDDDVYGDLATRPEPNTCDELIGTTLAPGASTEPCSFVGSFTGVAGDSQTDVVTVTGVDAAGNTVTASDDAVVTLTPLAAPAIHVDKTVTPPSRVEPGGDFTFTVVVTNPGPIPVTITSLTDDIYGNLATRPEPNTCDELIGTTLAPGASTAPCSFVGSFTGAAGATQTDVVTVVGTDALGRTVTDDDDAVVTLTPLNTPVIHVEKTVNPASRVEPGGDFTFTVVVSNPGPIPLTITSLTDDIYGNLATRPEPNTCDDLIGDTLAPGASTDPCSFVGSFTGVAGASQTDVVTVTGVDPIGRTVTDDDDATVTLTPVAVFPQIGVVKTVAPASRPAPGGQFTFTVVVSNPGPIPIVITSLVDDIYGNLATRPEPNTCDDLIGDTLAPGASTSPCTFTVTFTGQAGDTQTDVVTVTGVDAQGRTVTDNDDAQILLTPAPPGGPLSIDLEKTASPASRPEPGGTFTFTVVITNTSNVALTITSLTDDIYGNLGTRGGQNTCDDVVGDSLQPGGSVTCSFQGEFVGEAGDEQTDVVTVTGRDAQGRTVDADDDAEVTITDGGEPQIQVIKEASPLERTVPGGTFTFTVEVRNPSDVDIVLTELTDDVYGDLDGMGSCDTGGTIEAGESYTCEFDVEYTGSAPQSQTDTVTATGEDDDGNEVTDSDDATIRLVAAPSASPTPPPPAPPPGAPPAPPPPPPPPAPPAPAPPAAPRQPLSRTGGDFLKWFAFGLALISAGSVLRSRRAGDAVTGRGDSPEG